MNQTKRRPWQTAAAILAALLAIGLAIFTLASARPPQPQSVKAAIVNLDAGTELQGQFVPMGRQLSAELVLQDSQYEWEMSTPDLAADGLASGTYRAVVTIPEQFSEEVTSLANAVESDGDVVQAQIDVQAAPGASKDQADALELVTRAATSSFGGFLSGQVVTGLVGGFGQMGEQLGEAASGAHQVAGGVEQLADGTAELAGGAGQLADGATQAADGVGALAGGAGQLANGASQAADGVGALADGTSALADGAGQAASGLGGLAAGANALSSGAGQAAAGVQQLADGTGQLVGGIGQSATGAQSLAGGAKQFSGGLDEYVDGATTLAQGSAVLGQEMLNMLGQVDSVKGEVASGVQSIGQQLGTEVQAFLDANGAEVESAVQTIAQAAAAMSVHCRENPGDRACAGLTPEQWEDIAAPGFAQSLLDFINALPQVIPEQADGVAAELVAQIDKLLSELIPEGTQDDLENLIAGADLLAKSGTQIKAGGQEIAAGTQALADGLSQAASESAALVSGAGQASAGVSALASGAGTLADGAEQASAGVNALASGAGTLADGAEQASAGVNALASGMSEMAAGTTGLSEGAAALGGGATELADGLSTAVEMIPSFSEAQIQDLAVGVTEPIIPPTVATGVAALGAAAMALLLWLFTFFVAWVFPVFSPRVGRSVQSAWRLAFSTWWKPASWSAGMGMLTGLALGAWAGVSFGSVAALAGMGLFAAIVFLGVQQALAASLGVVGRVLSLAIFGVGMLATAPSLWGDGLSGLARVLPAGLATQMLNSVVVPGSAGIGFTVVGLAIWAAAAYFVATWATSRKRTHPTVVPGSAPA